MIRVLFVCLGNIRYFPWHAVPMVRPVSDHEESAPATSHSDSLWPGEF